MWLYLIPSYAAVAVGCFTAGALFIGDLDNDTATMRSIANVAAYAGISAVLSFVAVLVLCVMLSVVT